MGICLTESSAPVNPAGPRCSPPDRYSERAESAAKSEAAQLAAEAMRQTQ
jgi:hypothetical protein